MARELDRDSDTPLYRQLDLVLSEAIYEKTWRVGDRFPSESELMDAYKVSRIVVRAAVNDLVNQGLLRQIQGKGTFVVENRMIERPFQEFKGFYEEMAEKGIAVTTRVLTQSSILCNSRIGEELKLPWGSQVIEIERLRFIKDTPRYLVFNYIPYELCPDLVNDDLTNQSLYYLLEKKYKIILSHGNRKVRALAAHERMAKLLNITVNAPLIHLEGTSYSNEGKAVEFFQAYHRGDIAMFTYNVNRNVKS